MIMAMNPKLSRPVTSKMMNQVLSLSWAVLMTEPLERARAEPFAAERGERERASRDADPCYAPGVVHERHGPADGVADERHYDGPRRSASPSGP
jgi:hypothetical protein